MSFAKVNFDKFIPIGGKEVKELKEGILHSMPNFTFIENDFFKKKSLIKKCKIENKKHQIFVISINDAPYFFQIQDKNQKKSIVLPNLILVLQYPDLLPYVYVDDGAVKPLLGGSNLKGPGIKKIEETAPFEKNTVIAVRLLGNEEAFAVGITLKSLEEIRNSPQGDAIEILHVLKDQLWENREKIQ